MKTFLRLGIFRINHIVGPTGLPRYFVFVKMLVRSRVIFCKSMHFKFLFLNALIRHLALGKLFSSFNYIKR